MQWIKWIHYAIDEIHHGYNSYTNPTNLDKFFVHMLWLGKKLILGEEEDEKNGNRRGCLGRACAILACK